MRNVTPKHTPFRNRAPLTAQFSSLVIIIIKKGRKCKAERELYTPYQSEDPTPQYQPIDRNKRKGKRVEDYSTALHPSHINIS